MSLLLEALEAPAAAASRVLCLTEDAEAVAVPELARQARTASGWLLNTAGASGTVAALLSASHDCLATIFGAFRAGLTLVSLPHPARGMAMEEYLAQVGSMCAMTGATHLLADPRYLELLSTAPVAVHGFNEVRRGRSETGGPIPGGLVQFTSGSTGNPRGIELSLDAIDANLTSMYQWLEPHDGAVVCNWLPLSHDMGLIGFAFYALCSLAPPYATPTDLVLLAPEAFLTDPAVWLRACSDLRATSTAAPPFALRLAGRALRNGGARYDLSALRSFVVGSEPVSAEGLREFSEAAAPHGLPPTALCPGYGMAEASLAVAIGETSREWSSVRVDAGALAEREWREVQDGGVELVSCGPPLADVQIRTKGDADLGELELQSPSLLTRYVGGNGPTLTDEGWFRTADLAHLRGTDTYIVGRTDDVFVIAGRNLDARELDRVAQAHPATRPGNAAAVLDGEGRYLVIAEPNSPVGDAAALKEAGREIRVALNRRFSASPSAVIFIERGSLPKTPSGKIRRNHLAAQWRQGLLNQLHPVP